MEVSLVDHMGTDLSVVNAARVSFHKMAGEMGEKDEKLIKYLADHNHWSPFAHTSVCLRIKAPIFVARQLGKHQIGLCWNEVSRRYVDDPPEFFFPVLRQRPEGGIKQGSRNEFPVNLEKCEQVVSMIHEYARQAYKMLLEENVSPEQARIILPQSMYTEWIWTGSLQAFARVCNLRLDPHAQVECQDIAKQISDIVRPLFPISWSVLVAPQEENT